MHVYRRDLTMPVIRILEDDSSCLGSERLVTVISDDEMSTSDMVDHVGSTPMHTISAHMATLDPLLCGFLAANLACLSRIDLSLGTGCSGIDVLVPSLLMLCASLCTKYALPQLEWNQLWSCDIELNKRRWLRDVMAPFALSSNAFRRSSPCTKAQTQTSSCRQL